MKVEKGDGSTAFDFVRLDTRESLQKLADALNKRFPNRVYRVVKVKQPELIKWK